MGPLRLLDGFSDVLTPRMKKLIVKYTATSSTVDPMSIGQRQKASFSRCIERGACPPSNHPGENICTGYSDLGVT